MVNAGVTVRGEVDGDEVEVLVEVDDEGLWLVVDGMPALLTRAAAAMVANALTVLAAEVDE